MFTEDIFESKLSLIPDLNSGCFWHETEVSCMGRNFLFYIGLIWIFVMLLTRDIYS